MNNFWGLAGIVGGLAALFLFAWGIVYIIYRSESSTKKVDHKSPYTQPPESAANTKSMGVHAEHVRRKIPSMRKDQPRIQEQPRMQQRPPQKQQRRPPENRP